eukprot:6325151-Amphidinium_carterae.2
MGAAASPPTEVYEDVDNTRRTRKSGKVAPQMQRERHALEAAAGHIFSGLSCWLRQGYLQERERERLAQLEANLTCKKPSAKANLQEIGHGTASLCSCTLAL